MDIKISLFTTVTAIILVGRYIAFYVIDHKSEFKTIIDSFSSAKRGFLKTREKLKKKKTKHKLN